MEDKDESLVSHLEALRKMLIKCFVALGIGLLPMFLIAPYFIDWLIKIIISDNNITLNYFSPMEIFILQIKTAVVLDILLCFPYIAKQVWMFVLPALYDNEKSFIRSIVLSSSFLFVVGILFCIFLILPLIVNFGISFATPNIQAVFGISNIITLSLWLAIVFGVMFQFPLITYWLIYADIASYETIKDKRSYVFVIILIIAALLTPPDVISQTMLAIPTYLLFELGLFMGKKSKKTIDGGLNE